MLPGCSFFPLFTKYLQPRIGIHHINAPVHAMLIIIRALFFVLRLKYRSGDVIDQYRSKDNINRLNIDAVDAV